VQQPNEKRKARLTLVSNSLKIYVAVLGDEVSLCRPLARLLRATGLQPITYPSAEAFLADTKRPKFDCLVSSIQLEGMSGLQLSQRLSAVKNATPIVLITAHDEPGMRAQAQAAGCAGYFLMTDSGAAILSAVRRAVGLESVDFTQKNESGH
jgi:FixJ family two-component response regulator